MHRTGMRICWIALFALAAGCGLPEYYTRMDAQRARLQEFDEVNSLLDDPIDMPTMPSITSKEEKPAWPFDVHLRLPKGFGTAPKEKTPYYINFAFFRYGGEDATYNLFVVAAFVAESDKKQETGKYYPKLFRNYVKSALEDYYAKNTTPKFLLRLPENVKERTETLPRFLPYPNEGKPLSYSVSEYTDVVNKNVATQSVFRVHVHEEDGKQVCIVEQRPLRGASDEFDKAVKACLRTLDVSTDAGAKRAQFRKAKG